MSPRPQVQIRLTAREKPKKGISQQHVQSALIRRSTHRAGVKGQLLTWEGTSCRMDKKIRCTRIIISWGGCNKDFVRLKSFYITTLRTGLFFSEEILFRAAAETMGSLMELRTLWPTRIFQSSLILQRKKASPLTRISIPPPPGLRLHEHLHQHIPDTSTLDPLVATLNDLRHAEKSPRKSPGVPLENSISNVPFYFRLVVVESLIRLSTWNGN